MLLNTIVVSMKDLEKTDVRLRLMPTSGGKKNVKRFAGERKVLLTMAFITMMTTSQPLSMRKS